MKGWGSAEIGSKNFHILMMTQDEVYMNLPHIENGNYTGQLSFSR